jgi:hypothetical protein
LDPEIEAQLKEILDQQLAGLLNKIEEEEDDSHDA